MYDVHQTFPHLVVLTARLLADSSGNNDVKVAVVTTIGVVIAAGLTALTTTFQRGDKTPPVPPVSPDSAFTRQYIRALEADRREFEKLRREHTKLRDACWERGLDPDDLIAGQ